eukprot:TRINITY_DN59603_c0_g3_i1.p1 TRINITY_DN59603_c0_g3~~TRINITY_DN59603_c0_g3_i1.p1  ORF type:complete len:390 (-),score=34.36 TRINITY_DN59603_c0_g3_i1:69-1208(-)
MSLLEPYFQPSISPLIQSQAWKTIKARDSSGDVVTLHVKHCFLNDSYAFLLTDLQNVWINETDGPTITMAIEKFCPNLTMTVDNLCAMLKKNFDALSDHHVTFTIQLDENCNLSLGLDSPLQLPSQVSLPFHWELDCTHVRHFSSSQSAHDICSPLLVGLFIRPMAAMMSALTAEMEQLKQLLIMKDKELRTLKGTDKDVFLPEVFEREFLMSERITQSFEQSTLSLNDHSHLCGLYGAYMQYALNNQSTSLSHGSSKPKHTTHTTTTHYAQQQQQPNEDDAFDSHPEPEYGTSTHHHVHQHPRSPLRTPSPVPPNPSATYIPPMPEPATTNLQREESYIETAAEKSRKRQLEQDLEAAKKSKTDKGKNLKQKIKKALR